MEELYNELMEMKINEPERYELIEAASKLDKKAIKNLVLLITDYLETKNAAPTDQSKSCI